MEELGSMAKKQFYLYESEVQIPTKLCSEKLFEPEMLVRVSSSSSYLWLSIKYRKRNGDRMRVGK
jgi:hypothetical protein